MVIEDNELNMILVRDLLKLGGFEVIEAVTAEEGVQLARDHLPDLILMDIQLPGMDGLSATRIIKSDPDTKGIAVVALTSYAMQGDMEKAQEAGCVGYITKPIETRNFAKTISQYMKNDKV